MSSHAIKLEIARWTEGQFVPTFKVQPQALPIHPALCFPWSDDEAIRSRALKPIGFYVAYSYTLFRNGNDPQETLYAFF